MRKFFNFVAGLMTGSAVGAGIGLLLAPMPGETLRAEAQSRWEEAVAEARRAMEQTQREKELEYEMMKEAGEIR